MKKFGVAGLIPQIDAALLEYLGSLGIEDLVAVGEQLYEPGTQHYLYFSKVASKELTRLMTFNLNAIMDDKKLWARLLTSSSFAMEIMAFLADGSEKVNSPASADPTPGDWAAIYKYEVRD